MEIYLQMAYDAVAVGPYDLAAGVEFLKNGRFKNFPWVSANLMDKNHNLLFPAAKIIERGALKIGILGLTGQIAGTSPETIVADWRKVLPEHLERLTEECRLVIVLSSLSGEDNAELTRQFPQVHVLIAADRQQGNIVPRFEYSTLVTQTMSQGKYLGVLNLDWIAGSSWGKDQEQEPGAASGKEPSHLRSNFTGNFIPLSKSLPDDRQIAMRIEEIKQQIYTHNQRSTASGEQKNATASPAFSGLSGSDRCQECHPLQTSFWKSTRHAGAYATLQRQQQNFNLDCLPCHITTSAAEQAGTSSMESLLTLPAALQSVGCEACHGPGLTHADSPDKVKPQGKVKEKTCTACHTKERDPAFNYLEKILKVSCPAG